MCHPRWSVKALETMEIMGLWSLEWRSPSAPPPPIRPRLLRGTEIALIAVTSVKLPACKQVVRRPMHPVPARGVASSRLDMHA